MPVTHPWTARAGLLLLALALAATWPANAAAQSRLTFSLIGGTTSSGPGDDMTATFVARDFEHRDTCNVWPCPDIGDMTETGIGATGYPFVLDLRYAVLPWMGIGAQYGKTEIGATKGTNTDTNRYLRLRYETDVTAPTVWVSWRDMVRVAAGYARYGAKVTREDQGRASEDSEEVIWGPLLEGALAVRVLPQVALEARFQHRPVGEVAYGPYAVSERNSNELYAPATADFSHWFAGVGMVIYVTR